MDENTILGQLEELAHNLAIQVRYEPLKKGVHYYAGGMCILKGEYVVIINSKATTADKIQVLAGAVKKFDLSQVYLRPGLRDFLNNFTK